MPKYMETFSTVALYLSLVPNSKELVDPPTTLVFSPLLDAESYVKCTEELQNFASCHVHLMKLDFNYLKVL